MPALAVRFAVPVARCDPGRIVHRYNRIGTISLPTAQDIRGFAQLPSAIIALRNTIDGQKFHILSLDLRRQALMDKYTPPSYSYGPGYYTQCRCSQRFNLTRRM